MKKFPSNLISIMLYTIFVVSTIITLGTPIPITIQELKEEKQMPEGIQLRQVKYLNNIVEQDHRFIKNEFAR
ncbi:transposase [Peribacillus asahii]|uniref:Transposase n=1 Tax=Peribacillus asahii TaxID=228899 RepID=A0A3Q9RN27_9BACI|nr:transposase [Peribacillus asahii]